MRSEQSRPLSTDTECCSSHSSHDTQNSPRPHFQMPPGGLQTTVFMEEKPGFLYPNLLQGAFAAERVSMCGVCAGGTARLPLSGRF